MGASQAAMFSSSAMIVAVSVWLDMCFHRDLMFSVCILLVKILVINQNMSLISCSTNFWYISYVQNYT